MNDTQNTAPGWCKEHRYDIEFRQAFRALKSILGDGELEQARQFALLPSYAQRLLISDPRATVKLQIQENRFHSLFICPTSMWKLGHTFAPSLLSVPHSQRQSLDTFSSSLLASMPIIKA